MASAFSRKAAPLLGLAAGAGLAAAQLVPTLLAGVRAHRTALATPDFWSLHPVSLWETIAPHLFGDYYSASIELNKVVEGQTADDEANRQKAEFFMGKTLFKLGYSSEQASAIVSYIDATGTIEGAPGLKEEHLAIFDCSFKPAKGTRAIHYMGHIKMMAATQPFISGAISKTVNLPNDATIDDIAEAYIEAWREGLKAVAIYRDGSKGSQPLNVSDGDKAKAATRSQPGSRRPAERARNASRRSHRSSTATRTTRSRRSPR